MDARAERFPLVDSLRAVAALSVVGFHMAWLEVLAHYPDNPLGRYASRLNVGVTVFFVISGFLLYRPFAVARLRDAAPPPAGPYAWRRFLRIVPGYWVALTVWGLVVAGQSYLFTVEGFARHYGFAQMYFTAEPLRGLPPAWTLCVEVTFYALLPLWALAQRRLPAGAGSARRRLRGELGGLSLLALFGLAFAAVVARSADPNLRADLWLFLQLPNYLDAFAAGMALAVLSAWWAGRDAEPPRAVAFVARHPAACWGVALAAYVVACQLGDVARQTGKEYFATHRLFVVVAVGLLLPAVFGPFDRGAVRRVLAWRPLLWVGLVSYGVYLYHLLAWDRVKALGWYPVSAPGYVARIAVVVALSLVLAAASYYVVERPALRLRRLFAAAPRPDQPGAVSVPATPPRVD